MKNSANSPLSESARNRANLAIIFALLSLLICLAAAWAFRGGYILYYGDAQAHLNISRSIIDSRTPGYDQLGTVWLPLLHVLCLPFVSDNYLWSTGLAGTIPVACCFVVSGCFFYLAAFKIFRDRLAAVVVLALYALNPNVLYLATAPMTELVFFAGLSIIFYAVLEWRDHNQQKWIVTAVFATWAICLTRYDGWFLIPFIGLAFWITAGNARIRILLVFLAAASVAPLYWIGHNWWETGNPLDFYNGPYSATAIQGTHDYPGYHDWQLAIKYYSKAAQLCAGWPLVVFGVAGLVLAWRRRVALPILFLGLTPLFYVWSIHGSKTPIYVPQLPPHGYYNSRYGIAAVPLLAFATGAIVLALGPKLKQLAILTVFISCAGWYMFGAPQDWICWKESDVNSRDRIAWTTAAADYLASHYGRGQDVLAWFGDATGIFCKTQIPLAETIHEGNGAEWFLTINRPDILHRPEWVIARAGDQVAEAMSRDGRYYKAEQIIHVRNAPLLTIYRRRHFVAATP